MAKTSEIRKELWDYIKSIGVELTSSQHDKIKEIVERYVAEKGGFMGGLFQEMQKSNEKMNAHHRYYHPKCDKKPPPAKAKPGETMTTVAAAVGKDLGPAMLRPIPDPPGTEYDVRGGNFPKREAVKIPDGMTRDQANEALGITVRRSPEKKTVEIPKKKESRPHFHKRGQLRCELC